MRFKPLLGLSCRERHAPAILESATIDSDVHISYEQRAASEAVQEITYPFRFCSATGEMFPRSACARVVVIF